LRCDACRYRLWLPAACSHPNSRCFVPSHRPQRPASYSGNAHSSQASCRRIVRQPNGQALRSERHTKGTRSDQEHQVRCGIDAPHDSTTAQVGGGDSLWKYLHDIPILPPCDLQCAAPRSVSSFFVPHLNPFIAIRRCRLPPSSSQSRSC